MSVRRTIIAIALWVAAALAVGAATPQAARAEARLALIIANQGYGPKVGALVNPHNDAALMKATLERHGFTVRVEPEADRETILLSVDDFAQDLGEAGSDAIGFFYYTGHGAARPNTASNYIIPPEVEDASSRALWISSVPLEEVRRLLRLGAPSAAHIVVFDACRSELLIPNRGDKGFAPVSNFGGMLTAFSASPGQVANDGARGDGAGPYAKALAASLEASLAGARPLAAAEVFSQVRRALRRAGEAQAPIYSDGLDREVVFGGGAAAPPARERPAGDSAEDAATDPAAAQEALAQAAYDRVADSGDPRRLDLVARRFPDTFAGELAALEAEELRRAEAATDWRPSQADFRAAQRALRGQGFYQGPIDGDWGAGSERAMAAFQRAASISPADGELSEAALDALLSAPPREPTPEPSVATRRGASQIFCAGGGEAFFRFNDRSGEMEKISCR